MFGWPFLTPTLLFKARIIRTAMTSKEHLLMITVVAKQLQIIRTLTEILRSRGILEEDDMPAFGDLIRSDREMSTILLNDASTLYLSVAKGLGIDIAKATSG
jgi:hypothetical protein